MFAGWQTFYQMTAEAAATLTGLMFIVVTLSAGGRSEAAERGVRLFTSPTVFHLTSVLVISALALTPEGETPPPVWLMTAWSLGSLAYAATRLVGVAQMRRQTHWSDFWYYAVGPAVTYVALAGANIAALNRLPHSAYVVAICLLALLLLGIRNAWDLATWLAPRRGS
jgi:hypothetical protein